MISTTSSSRAPVEVSVKRADPIYMAHGYLTKVPIAAIEPFIHAYTAPGDLILDVFAGSGMTGVAAATTGRRAVLYDVSVLGQHIGRNYVRLVPANMLLEYGARVEAAARERVGMMYSHRCARCNSAAELSRRVFSLVVACRRCANPVNVYRAMEANGWRKAGMQCHSCRAPFIVRGSTKLCEEPVLDTVSCSCSRTLIDQDVSDPMEPPPTNGLWYPDLEIASDRQMFQASALRRNALTSTAAFYSKRNIAGLAALYEAIQEVDEVDARNKLLFAFTAILTRASKRYQWNPKRPLNAANQNYYVAAVFYEWNIFDLFSRKLRAVVSSDDRIRAALGGEMFAAGIDVDYRLGSAASLDLPDSSVDYVFTDPPFGSNIFYSDMNLFQEAWLGRVTDPTLEAVVDRCGNGTSRRSAARYEELLTAALRECHRVLKDDGHLSLVFSNSSGEIWALVQRVIKNAGFIFDEDGVSLLDKGQRSVKGLNSGIEHVVTADLVLTMHKRALGDVVMSAPQPGELGAVLDEVIAEATPKSPSHAYLGVVRHYMARHMDVAEVSFAAVSRALVARGFRVDAGTGRFVDS